jgi:hypothetical protein
MFVNTDCMTVLTRIPACSKEVERFCEGLGATKQFDRKEVWPTKDGLVDMSFLALHYSDWVKKTRELAVTGSDFFGNLKKEARRHGAECDDIAIEPANALHIGSAIEMIYAGQPEKGVVLYNRFARFAGLGPTASMSLIARNPLVISLGTAVLQFLDGQTFKVIKWA